MAMLLRRGLLSLLLLAGGADPAAAQGGAATADLAGVVQDQTGARLPGATVTVSNLATNARRATATAEDGRFFVPALTPGVYAVQVEMPDFETQVRPDVVLRLGSAVEIGFTLRVAGVTATATVVADSAVADLPGAGLANVIDLDQIGGLPINRRDFIAFSVITPVATVDRTPQQGASATSGLTFAGQRARSNNITVDGLDNNDATTGAVRATFSQEAVQEFQVLANSYPAEFGNASGGVVNIVTRSGTNELAGSAFFFLRDDALNARGHFERQHPSGVLLDRPKAPYGQRQFGATLGGPLRRDRTFYFLSFERLDVDASNFVGIDDQEDVAVFGQSFGSVAEILARAGFPVETGNVPYEVVSSQFLAKIDHQIRPDRRLSLRFNTASHRDDNIEPWGGLTARSRGAGIDSDDFMGALSYTAVHSPRAVNEFRFQIARRDQAVRSLDPRCDGRCDAYDEGGPTLEVAGVANAGRQRFTPQIRGNVRHQAADTFSYHAGAHHWKLGADYNYIDARAGSLPLHFGGRYIFSALPAIPGVLPAPVSAAQALALGLPAAYAQGYGDPETQYGYHDLAPFLQDDWRVRPDLSLKLGVRYQNQFWPRSEYRVPGLDPYPFPRDNDNVAPRLAVAWSPGGGGRVSLHAAYGLYYDAHLTGLVGIGRILNGAAGVRTLVLRFPDSLAAWNAPGRRLPETAVGAFPSLVFAPGPELETPYAHHASIGVDLRLPGDYRLSGSLVRVRGHGQVGALDYNPILPDLGPGRRPEDASDPVTGQPVAGTSASVLQHASFGETWYRGLALSLSQPAGERHQFLLSYTLSRAEDNSTDFQSAFVPENMGRGRNPADPGGLPLGFDPDDERGPSLQDQRHRFVFSGRYVLPGGFEASSIVTVASGRPFDILAGADLNGDGNGGAAPPDRARRVPADPSSSIGRNGGVMPYQATVDLRLSRRFLVSDRVRLDGMLDLFNLFNRTNFTEVNNVFGVGAYPDNPLPAFGRFEEAGPPFQAQLGIRVTF